MPERTYIQLVDAHSEAAGRPRWLLGGFPSEQPLLADSHVGSISGGDSATSKLSRIHDEIDRMYAAQGVRLDRLAEARDPQARAQLESEIEAGYQALRDAERRAATQMQRRFAESGVMARLSAGMDTIKRAKELLNEDADPSDTDEPRRSPHGTET